MRSFTISFSACSISLRGKQTCPNSESRINTQYSDDLEKHSFFDCLLHPGNIFGKHTFTFTANTGTAQIRRQL